MHSTLTRTLILFQSTLPARGATVRRQPLRRVLRISIHAPRTGSDDNEDLRTPHSKISIHAPRTGSDGKKMSINDVDVISIHAPRTGSDWLQICSPPLDAISIHAPRTGSDIADRILSNMRQIISIHAPRTGSDTSTSADTSDTTDFNPRSPHGERHTRFVCVYTIVIISIHAPRTGSDLLFRARSPS